MLGGGFNKIYPKENEWLFHKILNNHGCIVTEYAPNEEALKRNFPRRNRIISGLSDVVLIIEAEYRSGTSITAKFAKQQGKTVCCLPSNIDSKCGIGTNKLIQEGAKLIINPNEVMNIYSNEITKENRNQKNEISLEKEYKEVYEVIKRRSYIHINDICKLLNKDISQISTILTMLELEEYIEQLPGNEFKLKEDKNVH